MKSLTMLTIICALPLEGVTGGQGVVPITSALLVDIDERHEVVDMGKGGGVGELLTPRLDLEAVACRYLLEVVVASEGIEAPPCVERDALGTQFNLRDVEGGEF